MNDHLHVSSHGQIQVQQLFEDNSNKRTVLTTQPNGLTTVGKTGLPVVPERQLESIHRRQGSSTSLKSLEGMGKVKATPMTPEQAMKQYMQKLTSFEHHEIFSYPEIYFLGPNAKKRQGMTGGPNNGKETQPVNPKGHQSRIFIGGTDAETEVPILWPPDAKS